MTADYAARSATPEDAPAIARIYNEGIDGRLATFETVHRTAEQVAQWFDGSHPIVVVTNGDVVVGFASTSAYRPRACYAGIAEFSVYVDAASRGQGIGVLAMRRLEEEASESQTHLSRWRFWIETRDSLFLPDRSPGRQTP